MKEAFEIYVMKEGHWILYGRFEKKTQDEVIATAKGSLKANDITAVKLIKEEKNTKTGTKKNTLIFHESNDRPVRSLDTMSDLSLAVIREKRKKFRFQRPSQKKKQTKIDKIKQFLNNPFSSVETAGMPMHDNAETVIGLDEDFKKLAAGKYEHVEKGVLRARNDEELVVELTTIVMDFITISLAYLRKIEHSQIKNGSFSEDDRLGVNLFLAGACHYLAKRRKLNRSYIQCLVERSLILITNDIELSEHFSENYKKLLATPKNMKMFRSGADVLKDKVIGARYTGEGLAESLSEWSKIEVTIANSIVKEKEPKRFTIYTQISEAGSITTQSHVHLANFSSASSHNDIVRKIINKNNGREELHTGGGMVISFENEEEMIYSAIDIQTGILTHNIKSPKNAIDVRIWTCLTSKKDILKESLILAENVFKLADASQILLSSDLVAKYEKKSSLSVNPIESIEINGEEIKIYILEYARKGRLAHQDL